jgi:hypothetical protein
MILECSFMSEQWFVLNFKVLDFLGVLKEYIQDVYIFGCD